MKTRAVSILTLMVAATACEKKDAVPRAPTTIAHDPAESAAEGSASEIAGLAVSAGAAVVTAVQRSKPTWGVLAVPGASRTARLEGRVVRFRDAELTLPDVGFQACGAEAKPVPDGEHETDMVRDRSQRVRLEGGGVVAELRFSVDGVVLAVQSAVEDCRREADLTPWFLGTGVVTDLGDLDYGHPLDGVGWTALGSEIVRGKFRLEAPGESAADGVMVSATPKGAVIGAPSVGLELAHDFGSAGEWTLQGGLVESGELRVRLETERRLSGEGEALRSAVFLLPPDAERPHYWSVRRVGLEGSNVEEERVEGGFVLRDLGHPLRIEATRARASRGLMVGVGTCPELEGATEGEWMRDRVEWLVPDGDGWATLAEATRDTVQTAGCKDAVMAEMPIGKTPLADRAGGPNVVKWNVLSVD